MKSSGEWEEEEEEEEEGWQKKRGFFWEGGLDACGCRPQR